MKYLIIALSILIGFNVNAQVIGMYGAKEFNKDEALYKAKSFLISEVLKINDEGLITWFSVEPLAAASSGELTTLIVDCKNQNIGGLIFGFFGNFWDKGSGVSYTGYKFKYIDDENAVILFNKIDSFITRYSSFLAEEPDNNNIVFQFDDMQILITSPPSSSVKKMRIFWGDFDAEWEQIAFNRTKKRYNKKSK